MVQSMALKKLVLGLLIGLTRHRNVTVNIRLRFSPKQGCKLAIKCCRFAAFVVVLQLQNEITHAQWFCHLYAFEHCDADRNKRKSSPVLASSMRHPIKSRNSLVFNMRHSMAQKVMKSGKSASTNGGDASRVGFFSGLKYGLLTGTSPLPARSRCCTSGVWSSTL